LSNYLIDRFSCSNPMGNNDLHFMQHAVSIARQGEGYVEPNPMVGCVLVKDGKVIGEGFHQKFGGPHAEVNAIASCDDAIGATAYVTLEPCCHHGKTGPCTQALIDAQVREVVVGYTDPNPKVAGQGLEQLRQAGIEVRSGVCEHECRELIQPFIKLVSKRIPWVIAKWAMTMDGKIATATGSSQWISCEASRKIVHQIRGRVDAVMVGIGTVLADDPMLNARPSGARSAIRVVIDPKCEIPTDSKLAQSAKEIPLLVATCAESDQHHRKALLDLGCELFDLSCDNHADQLQEVLQELGRRQLTNILCEGGSKIFGVLNDHDWIDEVHCFIAPKIIGGANGLTPIGGRGFSEMNERNNFRIRDMRRVDADLYATGRLTLL
ncbi:MAG: bifunctional diaminohydroxyphosphoribosylaminopyrimidine deaminase/5-amino-6-(5-phosphoribosylamino)uracil reductase RibD, partial [Planctomycetota bacterium]